MEKITLAPVSLYHQPGYSSKDLSTALGRVPKVRGVCDESSGLMLTGSSHKAWPTCLSFFVHRFSMTIDSSSFVQGCPELNVLLWNILELQSAILSPPGD